MLLAIDTSTTIIGIAAFDGTGLLSEYSWDSQRNHTAQLVPQIDTMLRRSGRVAGDIQAVAIAIGPGSWSGLRVGLSAAKGIAIARDLPLIGIGTLDVLAYQYGRAGQRVVPLIRLGRERFATTDPAGGPPRNITLAVLAAESGVATLFCGDIDREVQSVLTAQLGKRARFPSPAALLRRPGYLAELAWQRFLADESSDLTTLEPIYLGQPVRTPSNG